MKELPVKVQVVEAQMGMTGNFGIVVVIEGFDTKDEAKDHAKYLGRLIDGAGYFKNEVEAEASKKSKKPKHIKLLSDL